MLRLSQAASFALCGVALAAAQCQAAPAAGCQRPIMVASSPVGRAMMMGLGQSVSGAVKDFLDLVSADTGCSFSYRPVPRARAWMMLEAGRADMLPAAAQSAQRDQYAQFIPTHEVRPMLISLDRGYPGIGASDELLRTRMHIGVVRSYDFGPTYRSLLAALEQQDRLHVVADPQALATLLQAGVIQAALLPPSAFADAGEASLLAGRLQLQTLADLPRIRIGFYLSTSTLAQDDQATLRDAIRKAVARGDYASAMRKHYPAWALKGVTAGAKAL